MKEISMGNSDKNNYLYFSHLFTYIDISGLKLLVELYKHFYFIWNLDAFINLLLLSHWEFKDGFYLQLNDCFDDLCGIWG